MGSGKSVIGKQLSVILGYPFYDTDAQISAASSKSVSEIFSEQGETYFRTLEEECMVGFFSNNNSMIVATGGGLPCHHDLMNQMNQYGETVYLKLAPELLYKRLRNQTLKRPLLAAQKDLLLYIRQKLETREPIYTQASQIITITEHNKIHEVCQTILQTIHFNEEKTKL